MNDGLKGTQKLYLWSLIANGGEGFVCEQPVVLKGPERSVLVKGGLVDKDKRKRPETGRVAGYDVLTDKGWAWAVEHMQDRIDSRSTKGSQVLGLILARLDDYLREHSLALADVIAARPAEALDVEGRIRASSLDLGRGQTGQRIRLAHLRDVLADVPRETLDAALARLQAGGELILYPLDDPQERTPEDEAAAIDVAGVGKRHFLILER